MFSPAPIEVPKTDSLTIVAPGNCREGRDVRFSDLRGVQWRINLGILPSSAPTDELRRVSADARRRYAGLRRRLLVDPHIRKDGSSSPDPVIDNPLSQNPDSMWGRFFKSAELEKMVDQDLSRLYPEHGSYFQTPACQSMLRRILLLWCLRHPEYGYGQGMHELLAPLLYVLHIDVQRLSEVRKQYEDHFNDKFDDMSFPESGLVCKHESLNLDLEIEDESNFQESAAKDGNLDELDSEIQTIVLLSDAYGAEGELGIVLSERFMEHDAYCMFESLMGGARGVVALAEYFSPSPALGSHTGLPPVIEASSALYHLLSVADSSLHSHLTELGVEPQYFALRWLRVLFGREFSLDDLLVIWDEIFASDNGKSNLDAEEYSYGILRCSRGAFISAMAVSMLLYLRSSLLATENATSCLQRLLSFPENVDLKKLIEKAKSMQVLALDKSISSLSPALIGSFDRKSSSVRGHSLSTGSISPRTPLNLVPGSYWEEKWMVLLKAEEQRQGSTPKKPSWKKGFAEKVRSTLTRAESDPSPRKPGSGKRESRSSVKRNLLEDLSRELGLDEDFEAPGHSEVERGKDSLTVEVKVDESRSLKDRTKHHVLEKNTDSITEETSLSRHTGSEEYSSVFSASSSPVSGVGDQDNDFEKSSVASNSSAYENDVGSSSEEHCGTIPDDPPLPVSDTVGDTLEKSSGSVDAVGKQDVGGKDAIRKLEAGVKDGTGKQETGGKEQRKPRFQWLWKLGRNANEGTSEKGGNAEASRSPSVVDNENIVLASSMVDGRGTSPRDIVDKNVMGTLRNLGQSMLENVQVIESVFQQDHGQVDNMSRNMLVGKGQVTAVAALKELRKISNLLSEM